MKRIFIALFTVLTIAVVIWLLARTPCNSSPQRPSSVPRAAVWRGEVDEGFWFAVAGIDTAKGIVRLRIYADYNGELVMDANYKEQDNCLIRPFSSEHILAEIFAYDHHNIDLKKSSCKLVLMKPVFGGSFSSLAERK